MTIDELKVKDDFVFYTIEEYQIRGYRYLMPMPVKNLVYENMYHIIINKELDKPERIYHKKLQEILDEELFSFEDAKKEQIRIIEGYLNYLKK